MIRRTLDRVSGAEAAVFVSGVASMGLEILAGRIIAPQFGSSIYTWGTIIGIFLAALSLGYHRGGRRASRRATPAGLARLFVLTAAYVAGLVFAGDLLVRATVAFPMPSRTASLPAVALLFGPPTYLLGFVTPTPPNSPSGRAPARPRATSTPSAPSAASSAPSGRRTRWCPPSGPTPSAFSSAPCWS